MKKLIFLVLFLSSFVFGEASPRAQEAPPVWAYPVNPADFKLAPDDGMPRQVPQSSTAFSLAQTRDLFFAPDWHPDDHPSMPEIVAHGRKPEVFACGFCHRADGPGGPENASLAGLSVNYIVQQMADIKKGLRTTAVPERSPVKAMIKVAKAASADEVQAAAAYFAALKPRSTIRVLETDIVPKTYVAGWFLAESKPGENEVLGNRIIEVPEDVVQFENRDARSRFIAYAPIGSVKKGEALAAGGIGNSAAECAACHGPGLTGVGDVPGIAGRSPSYLVRQLYDFKVGARAGANSEQMKSVAQALTVEDMMFLAAYAASLPPQTASSD